MSDISINKSVKRGRDFGDAVCACGEVFQRSTGGHKRCADCARKSELNVRTRKFDYYFPVIHDDLRWLGSYLLFEDADTASGDWCRENRKDVIASKERNEANVVTPCDDCPLAKKCIAKRLACRAFWVWSSSEKKKNTAWGVRENPSRDYYKRVFPGSVDTRAKAEVPAKA